MVKVQALAVPPTDYDLVQIPYILQLALGESVTFSPGCVGEIKEVNQLLICCKDSQIVIEVAL